MASNINFTSIAISDYAKTLSNEDLAVYLDKLTVSDQNVLPDPYSLSKTDWSNNAKLWPDIAYPDIYNYFVDSIKLYSKEDFKSYKSLDGHQYFMWGHVQPVLFHDPNKEDYVFLMADVLPSQRQGGKKDMYKTYLIVHKNGQIHTAHCTCVAGAGKSCSHAAAMAFKVEAAIRTGLTTTASTSSLCAWNDLSRKKAEPSILSKIDFRRRKYGQELKAQSSQVPTSSMSNSVEESENMKIDFTSLRAIQPDAVVFKSLEIKKEPPLPPTICESVKTLGSDVNEHNFVSLFSSLLSPTTIANLEQATVKQSKTEVWKKHRLGRITSSRMHRVFTLRESTDRSKVVQDILQPRSVTMPAMTYGIQNEPIARLAYIKYSRIFHDGFMCAESGLVIDQNLPHLGASPDGLVECECCGKGCLEIKCLKTYESGIPDPDTSVNLDNNFPISSDFEVKRGHKFYTQVQGHMLICKVDYCDLYLWSRSKSLTGSSEMVHSLNN